MLYLDSSDMQGAKREHHLYYMHVIESKLVLRSDFSDEDMLYCIYQKLLAYHLSDNCTLHKSDQK